MVYQGNRITVTMLEDGIANMQYNAENEQAILRGNPATVTDAQNGSSRSTEITMFMKENRFVGNGKTRQNKNGRVKSVYNVKPTQ